jgi:outer membrane protein OmpA-like peptidoglycan-associated protein
MMKRMTVAVGVLTLAACTEDLAPITKVWTETAAALTTQVTELSKAVSELKAKAGGVAMPAADDKEGLDLKAKLDASVAGLEAGVVDTQKLITAGTTAVNEALTKGKIAGVQAAMDKVKAEVAESVSKLKAQLGTAEGLLGDLDKHAADLAAKAKAAAAAAAVAPPTVDASKAGEADYANIRFKDGTEELDLESPATKANLDALVSLMTSCKEITVEVEGHTSKVGEAKKNKELSAKRAQAVTRHLINVGKVSPSQIKKTYGFGSEKPAMDEPEPGSEAEKAMDAEALKQVRARNERVRLRIVKPCPAGK